MDAGFWVHLESVRKFLAAAEAVRIAQDSLHFPCQKEGDRTLRSDVFNVTTGGGNGQK